MNNLYLFALANAGMCGAICFICLCRLNSMQKSVRMFVKSEYAILMGAALLSAMQPLYGEWPRYGSVGMSLAMLFQLISSAKAWRGDRVPAAATTPGELRNMDGSAI